MRKSKVYYNFRNQAMNLILGNVRTRLINMISFSTDKKPIVADLGCGKGNLTQILCEHAQSTIAVDVDKHDLLIAKNCAKNADFICADITHLPLKANLADIAVVASVFEFIEDLENAVKETKNTIRKGGILIAGYPIQTRFVKATVEVIDKRAVKMWDPCKVMTPDQCRKDFHTHKQEHRAIRESLERNFRLLEKARMPLKHLPDSISIYEFVKLLRT